MDHLDKLKLFRSGLKTMADEDDVQKYKIYKGIYHQLINQMQSKSSDERKIALKALIKWLHIGNQVKDYFHHMRGSEVIIKLLKLEDDRNVAEAAIYALACCAENHMENQKSLQNMDVSNMLYAILQNPNFPKYPTFLCCALVLILTIVSHNSAGQRLIQQNGCLLKMISLFHDILSKVEQTEDSIKESLMDSWNMLCKVLGACVNNPRNSENQNEVSNIFPKALEYLAAMDYQEEKSKIYAQSCLHLFTQVISGNESNQNSFTKCGGILYLKSLITNHRCLSDALEPCLMVLDAVVSSNAFCSHEALKLDLMPFLVEILKEGQLKTYIPLLLLLCHLMETDVKHLESFKRHNGPSILMEMIADYSDEDLDLPIKFLLWQCLQEDNESPVKFPDELMSPDLFQQEDHERDD